MTDDARAVWVEGADPALVSSDDILDFAKIVGDVEVVKLQYHSVKRSVFYRVVFRQSSAAQAFLHLEGTRFKDCVLHLVSTVFGSIDTPPALDATSADEEREKQHMQSRRGANTAGGIAADKSAIDPATPVTHHPLLPYYHEFAENSRLDEALIPFYGTLTQILAHWKDPEGHARPSDLSTEEEAFLKESYGLDVLCPLMDEFAQLHQETGAMLSTIAELKAASRASDAEMEGLLKKRAAERQNPSAQSHQVLRTGVESTSSAEAAKALRVRSVLPVSSQLSHPLSLLIALNTVCGPVSRYQLTHTSANSSFHICIEFLTESCAARALSMLSGTYSASDGAQKKGRSQQPTDDSDAALIGSLALLKGAQWEAASVAVPFSVPTEVPKVKDALIKTWASRLRGGA